MPTRNFSFGLLLAGVLICGCSKSAAPAGTGPANGGSAGAGGTATAGAGANTGGTGGTSGTAGAAPFVLKDNNICPPHSVAQNDDPCLCSGGVCTQGCACSCEPGFPAACADGCFDLQSDLDHCGSCTTMCYTTGQCNQGVCNSGVVPPPVPSQPLANGSCPMGSTLNDDDMLCYCPRRSLRTTVCAEGCTDTQSDPNHCGSCTVACDATTECNPTQLVAALNEAGDCPAGSIKNQTTLMCYAGACNAAPTVVVPASTGCGSLHLTMAAGVLFWTDTLHGTVQSLPAGGTPTMIATDQMAPTLIQVNGSELYWLNSESNEIMTASTAGGAATALVSVPPQPDAGAAQIPTDIGGFTLSADGRTLFFSSGMLINKITVADPATVTEVGRYDAGVPKALVVDGDLLGFPTVDGTVQLMTLVDGDPAICAAAGSTAVNHNCSKVASAAGVDLENVFSSNGVFYWVNYGQILSSSPENRMTGAFDTVAGVSPPATKVTAFTIQGDTVYFAENTGLVLKAPLTSNAPTTKLARGQLDAVAVPPVGVSSIAADATTMYWANPACEILSLPVTTGDPI